MNEAEFYSLGRLAAELLFGVYVGKELGMTLKARARTDSSAARGMAGRTGSGSVRHIHARYLWSQERVREKALAVEKWKGEENPADLGTKVLQGARVRTLSAGISLRPPPYFGSGVGCLSAGRALFGLVVAASSQEELAAAPRRL